MPSKWDLVLDQKAVPLEEHLLSECAALFAKDLSQWPPAVESESPALTAMLQLQQKAPTPLLMREAFRLARWDLERELNAYDEYMRNRGWLERGLAPADKPMLLFFSRFIGEQLLALAEHTQGRLTRPALLRVLDLTQAAVLKVEGSGGP
jgi:hypothetical protein